MSRTIYIDGSELSGAEPARPADMYERRIAVLERENHKLRIELEQSRNGLAPIRQEFINQVTDLVNQTYETGVNPIEFVGQIRAMSSEYFEKCDNEVDKWI